MSKKAPEFIRVNGQVYKKVNKATVKTAMDKTAYDHWHGEVEKLIKQLSDLTEGPDPVPMALWDNVPSGIAGDKTIDGNKMMAFAEKGQEAHQHLSSALRAYKEYKRIMESFYHLVDKQ